MANRNANLMRIIGYSRGKAQTNLSPCHTRGRAVFKSFFIEA
ncbi:hypothetical protein Poly41_33070 [Novipirellula artificiosorum]|uniref:Uncharacterized protein n=1 Tax=Novipirellula artificiosorum TaxID=2528016 RepID=A0A5C6DK17_9BACT|nr:hypothetical protein Poly41_33070 [Novipirellula artificiosorum]